MSGSASSSSAAQQELLPLIGCPLCGKPLLTLIARKGQRPGSRYYKCVDYDDGICSFFEFQDQYARRIAPEPPAHLHQVVLPVAAAPATAGRGAGRGCAARAALGQNPATPADRDQRGTSSTSVLHKPADLNAAISLGRSYQVMAAAGLLVGCANLLLNIFLLGVAMLMFFGSNTQ